MGKLWIICGAAGVGKSTYGKKIAAQKNACFLDSDTVTEPVVRAGMTLGGEDPDDRDSPNYRAAFRDPVYECLYATAAENLSHLDVVLVGPFTSEIRDPDWLSDLIGRFGVEVEVIYLTCDEVERKRRIAKRGNPRDSLKLQDWARFGQPSDAQAPAFPHQLVDTESIGA